jgi:hypothetical protein
MKPHTLADSVVRPRAVFRDRVSDDYVVRLSLPGSVVHDCTLSQARAFDLELREVIATAERHEQRDRRVRR